MTLDTLLAMPLPETEWCALIHESYHHESEWESRQSGYTADQLRADRLAVAEMVARDCAALIEKELVWPASVRLSKIVRDRYEVKS
jgi:hypothetical protein